MAWGIHRVAIKHNPDSIWGLTKTAQNKGWGIIEPMKIPQIRIHPEYLFLPPYGMKRTIHPSRGGRIDMRRFEKKRFDKRRIIPGGTPASWTPQYLRKMFTVTMEPYVIPGKHTVVKPKSELKGENVLNPLLRKKKEQETLKKLWKDQQIEAAVTIPLDEDVYENITETKENK